jgi:hypothetical protein
MSEVAEKLMPDLLALPAEGSRLRTYSTPQFPPENDDEFLAELNRRRAEHESGNRPGIPVDEFFRKLREKRS